ncbi:MAG TPA: hypothetical protein DCP92_24705 [Nitrospiraceae bacterium]|jgi:hypothetical protein|nr:hypothetical protein [Nitrospiraceae bacterium]
MAEYSRIASGTFTTAASPITQVVNLPFQPQRVKLRNTTAYSSPAQNAVTYAEWDVNSGQGVAIIEYIESAGSPWILAADYVGSLGISSFGAGLSLQYGAAKQIIGATAANPIVFNVTAHGYSVGDIVVFEGLYQSSTTGMPQISGMPFRISAVGDANHFSVVWPGSGSNYTALSGSPTGATVMKVLNPFLYAPGVAFIEAISTGTTTTVTTTAPHNFVVGQEIAFRIPSAWGTTQLNSLPDATIPGSPIYYYVTSVSSTTQFVCNANSTGFTAFNTNQTVASVPGLSFPQVLAVGDVNSGGVAYSGGALYPSPSVNGASTINGPAISGSFVNGTAQGFTVGLGTGTVNTSALLLTASSTYIWEAVYYDFGS